MCDRNSEKHLTPFPRRVVCHSLHPSQSLVEKKKAEETQLFDSHAPRRWRVMGTLSNSDGFQKAFQCPKGSVMNRGADRCQLW